MKLFRVAMIMAGILLILNGFELYSKLGNNFYPGPSISSESLNHAIFFTVIDDVILIAGSFLIGIAVYLSIKNKYHLPKLKHFWLILAVYSIILMLAGGVIHIIPSGYQYPDYVYFLYGEPMFTPNLLLYRSHLIGIYIYPFQVLSLVAAAVLGSIIFSLSLSNLKFKKSSPLSLLGAIGVCPACATGTFFGLVIGASPFLSAVYLNDLYGNTFNEILISVLAVSAMFVFLLYMIYRYRVDFKIAR